MEEDHYCLDSILLEFGDKGVDRIGLIKERQPRHSVAGDDVGSSLLGQANERHLDSLEVAACVGRKNGVPGPLVNDVGGEELEASALEGFAALVLSVRGQVMSPAFCPWGVSRNVAPFGADSSIIPMGITIVWFTFFLSCRL